MSHNTKSTSTLTFLTIGITVLQLLDIFIHAATDQVEIIRVASNGLILLWLALGMAGKLSVKAPLVSTGFIGGYLILNFVFLARAGLTNPGQGGSLRIALFLFVLLTVSLSTWLAVIRSRRISN